MNWPPDIGIKPYYVDDSVVIYHGDCREVLPKLPKVDLVLTDPPYGIDGKKSGTMSAATSRHYKSYQDTPENHALVVVPVIKTCIRTVHRVVLTPGMKMLWRFPKPKHVGAFIYSDGAFTMSAWGRQVWQPILYYGKDPYPGRLRPDSVRGKGAGGSHIAIDHPCPKPYADWLKLVDRVSLAGETILDPFMGSGTTLRAAKDLGRKAIGIEIEEKYCEIAANRCSYPHSSMAPKGKGVQPTAYEGFGL